jgi:hypothetical protein
VLTIDSSFAGHRPGQRVAAVGGAVGTDGHHAGAGLCRQQRADRETAAQRFGGGQHIGRHAVVHIGIQLAGAPDPGLHFIENQQGVVLVAKLRRPRKNSTLAGTTPLRPAPARRSPRRSGH